MSSSLADLQKERGFPHPSRKKKLLKLKRESTRSDLLLLAKLADLAHTEAEELRRADGQADESAA